MRLWPGLRWFVTPSGKPVEAGTLWRRVLWDAPLLAHAWGAWLALVLTGGHYVPALVLMGAWQAAKWDDGVYGASWPREIGWRLLIGAVASLPALR